MESIFEIFENKRSGLNLKKNEYLKIKLTFVCPAIKKERVMLYNIKEVITSLAKANIKLFLLVFPFFKKKI